MSTGPNTPTAVIAGRVRELRRRRGWTAADLGARLTEHGVRWNRSVVANFESGRRPAVSVQELLALALVLDVAPVNLLAPLDDEQPYQITPTRAEVASAVRAWVRGEQPLPGTAPEAVRTFYAEASLGDLRRPT